MRQLLDSQIRNKKNSPRIFFTELFEVNFLHFNIKSVKLFILLRSRLGIIDYTYCYIPVYNNVYGLTLFKRFPGHLCDGASTVV